MKLFFVCLFGLLSFGAVAQPKSAKSGVTYGAGTTAADAVDVNTLEAKLITTDKYTGKVKGTVTGVCLQKGCWMKLAQTNGEGIMIRFKDYKFFMPKDIIGKEVVLEGVAERTTTDVEMLKHYAEDAGKSKAEIEKIKEPKTAIEFVASGVLVI